MPEAFCRIAATLKNERNCNRDLRTPDVQIETGSMDAPGVANVLKQPNVNLKSAFHKISRESTFVNGLADSEKSAGASGPILPTRLKVCI